MTEKITTKQLKSVSTDVNLGNSDVLIPTQKAVKTYTDTAVSHSVDGLQTQIDTINSKIPSTASDTNKLADKDFVNSSIATNTAIFRGTYDSLPELEAVTADENDYGFVVTVDAAGNTVYNRYKYTTATTPASWVFEYALNNSSFTATQWAAINSGATSTNIGQIATNTTNISNHVENTNNPHSVTKAQVGLGNVDNTSDADKPVSTATQTALNAKANSADLATVATSGLYSDLTGTPSLAAVATSGAYSDLTGKPTIPTTLTALTGDVSISSPVSGEHLVYDGSKWKNTTSSASVSWGGITGTLSNQTDLQNALNAKQGSLTAGDGIDITGNVISFDGIDCGTLS